MAIAALLVPQRPCRQFLTLSELVGACRALSEPLGLAGPYLLNRWVLRSDKVSNHDWDAESYPVRLVSWS